MWRTYFFRLPLKSGVRGHWAVRAKSGSQQRAQCALCVEVRKFCPLTRKADCGGRTMVLASSLLVGNVNDTHSPYDMQCAYPKGWL